MIILLKSGKLLTIRADAYSFEARGIRINRVTRNGMELVAFISGAEWEAFFLKDEDYVHSFAQDAIRNI